MTKNSEPCGKNNYQRKTKESRRSRILTSFTRGQVSPQMHSQIIAEKG